MTILAIHKDTHMRTLARLLGGLLAIIAAAIIVVGVVMIGFGTLVWPWLSTILDWTGVPSTGNFQGWGA